MKDLGGNVFDFVAAGHAPGDEGVDAIEIGLYSSAKRRGSHCAASMRRRSTVSCPVAFKSDLRAASCLSTSLMMRAVTKVTVWIERFSGFFYPGLGLLS